MCVRTAWAGPPYVTDDPEPTDLGKWEIYGFGDGTRFAHSTEAATGFDINYGAAKDLQLTHRDRSRSRTWRPPKAIIAASVT